MKLITRNIVLRSSKLTVNMKCFEIKEFAEKIEVTQPLTVNMKCFEIRDYSGTFDLLLLLTVNMKCFEIYKHTIDHVYELN